MKKNIISISAVIVIIGVIFASCKKDEKETSTPIMPNTPTSDLIAPVINYSGNTIITHVLNAPFTEPIVTAEDNIDGDLTSSIVKTGTVNKDLADTYFLTYSVSDLAGNSAEKTIQINVVNSAAYLAGIYSVSEAFTYNGTTDNFTYNQTITTSNSINNKIFFQRFGDYKDGIVYATVTGTTLTIPQQDVVCGTNPQPIRTFMGQGSFTSSTINYTYSENTSGTSGTGSATLTKQ